MMRDVRGKQTVSQHRFPCRAQAAPVLTDSPVCVKIWTYAYVLSARKHMGLRTEMQGASRPRSVWYCRGCRLHTGSAARMFQRLFLRLFLIYGAFSVARLHLPGYTLLLCRARNSRFLRACRWFSAANACLTGVFRRAVVPRGVFFAVFVRLAVWFLLCLTWEHGAAFPGRRSSSANGKKCRTQRDTTKLWNFIFYVISVRLVCGFRSYFMSDCACRKLSERCPRMSGYSDDRNSGESHGTPTMRKE